MTMLIKYLASITLIFTLFITGCSATKDGNNGSQVSLTDKKALTLAVDPQPIATFSGLGVERAIFPVIGDIYRFFDNNHSSLFLVADEGVLFIDPLNVEAAKWVNSEINRLFGKKITHVLYSHGHQDHASGAAEFGNVEIISHIKTFEVINPPKDQALIHGYDAHDKNGDGVIQRSEADEDLATRFSTIDTNSDGLLTGQETESYINRNVIAPTKTFDEAVHTVEFGGKSIEMHFVGGNHAVDMSYIFFPEESLIFYVDVISLRAIPFGPLAWYSKEDSENTYAVALAIDADIAVPSHGPIGTQDDVRDLQKYMTDLRMRVAAKIDEGLSLEEIQMTLDMQDYAHFDYFTQRLPQNILGMHRVLMEEISDN